MRFLVSLFFSFAAGVRISPSPPFAATAVACRRRALPRAVEAVPGESCTGEKVVVVGATGYIGKAVVRESVRRALLDREKVSWFFGSGGG